MILNFVTWCAAVYMAVASVGLLKDIIPMPHRVQHWFNKQDGTLVGRKDISGNLWIAFRCHECHKYMKNYQFASKEELVNIEKLTAFEFPEQAEVEFSPNFMDFLTANIPLWAIRNEESKQRDAKVIPLHRGKDETL